MRGTVIEDTIYIDYTDVEYVEGFYNETVAYDRETVYDAEKQVPMLSVFRPAPFPLISNLTKTATPLTINPKVPAPTSV